MALKDNPGLTTMPRTDRDWTKFINELSGAITVVSTDPPTPEPDNPDPPPFDYVTLNTNQTITGLKVFSGNNPRWNSFPLLSVENVSAQIDLLPADTSPDASDSVVTTASKKVALSQIQDDGIDYFMVD